jgi:hypothetical protein
MDYTNLQVLAEVSVTLLGLSGLTAVIGQSKFDQRGVAYRTQLLLYTSSVAFVGSFLPLIGIPLILATIGMAASLTILLAWGTRYNLGWFQQKIRASLVLILIFFLLVLCWRCSFGGQYLHWQSNHYSFINYQSAIVCC